MKMKNKAFTLIEILVTTTIFVSIFSIISGLFFSALKVQRRALAFQELIKESSYVMEYMGRQLRMAQKSDFGHDCAFEDPNYKNYLVGAEGDSIAFRNYDDECWTFSLDSQRLKVTREDSSNSFEDFLTSENIKILDFKINLSGDGTGDEIQPRITLLLKARGGGLKTEQMPEIQIQTTISQRNLDI